MTKQPTPESYLHLPIPAPANERSQQIAAGPELWANLLVKSAVEADHTSELLHKLTAGKVALGVIFAPDDWRATKPLACHMHDIICGDLKADGNVLSVGMGLTREKGVRHITTTFSRDSIDAPYRPVELQDDPAPLVQFPADTSKGLPSGIKDGLEVVQLMATATSHMSQLPESLRWVPYIRIRDL